MLSIKPTVDVMCSELRQDGRTNDLPPLLISSIVHFEDYTSRNARNIHSFSTWSFDDSRSVPTNHPDIPCSDDGPMTQSSPRRSKDADAVLVTQPPQKPTPIPTKPPPFAITCMLIMAFVGSLTCKRRPRCEIASYCSSPDFSCATHDKKKRPTRSI